MIRDLLDFVAAILRAPVGLVLAVLPHRRWASLDALPIHRMALPSSIVTLFIGFLTGLGGFLAYAQAVTDLLVRAAHKEAVRQFGPGGELLMPRSAPVGISLASPLGFLFFTPLGWLSMYLVISGIVRAVSIYVEDPIGDPVLTGLDALLVGGHRRTRQARERQARERQEGADVPDALYTGAWAGLPDVDYVVVAARRKKDWTAGTAVITNDKWYTLGQPFDIRMPGGLRTAYPLTEQKVVEVLRRGVHYDLPALRQGPPRPS